ncbi:hypothetical protein KIPB_009100, partial [Kipferlia bialata]|eukprot:g9100.t1
MERNGNGVSAAPLGNNEAMVTYFTPGLLDGCFVYIREWKLLSLEGGALVTSTIPGPVLDDTTCGFTLIRVGGCVVAYATHHHSPRVPVWLMSVYTIDTGEWQNIEYVEGAMPEPRDSPDLFAFGDAFVVSGGYTGQGSEMLLHHGVWEWSSQS